MRARHTSLLLGAALAAAALPAEAVQNTERRTPPEAEAAVCATDAAEKEEALGPPVFVEGFGYAGIVPDTAEPEARRWFEQGIRLVWAYDEVEAIRAFQEAQRRDPACAMCFWGEALARGPTLNLQPRTEEHAAAAAATAKAASLSAKLGPRDRALIRAMQVRTGGKGKFENKRYMKAMAGVARRFGGDDAVLVMAADAEIVHASRKGLKEGSGAQRLLETVLARNPDHSGAIHLYIHLTDIIDRQPLAERYADRLGRIAPAASHLVHMPSHTFFGVGRYKDAAAVNVAALAADRAFVAKARPAKSDYRTGLYGHNGHFAIQSALMRGDGATALSVAEDFRARFPDTKGNPFRAVSRASTWYAAGLHAPVGEVLKMPEPEVALSRAARFYARGEALARNGDAAAVRAEAAAIAKLRAGPDGPALGPKPVQALVEMAQRVLEGRAAMIENRFVDAQAAFRAGMTLQETAGFGSDPPPFWYPVRRSLAAAMLAAGDAAGARLQLIALLEHWPNDPLALYAFSRAEEALGRKDSAAQYLARARAGWQGRVEEVPLTRI